MEGFLRLVLNGEVTGFNFFCNVPYWGEGKTVMYGHADYGHLQLVFDELGKEHLLVKHSVVSRYSVYLFDDGWVPGSNTVVVREKGRLVAKRMFIASKVAL
ncbi:hypothetical protein KAR91_39280 [Candidatus Pacearchaeota archaeon]|nr:hypothetical protein [Candidatus Pacearchaeota archaeon]